MPSSSSSVRQRQAETGGKRKEESNKAARKPAKVPKLKSSSKLNSCLLVGTALVALAIVLSVAAFLNLSQTGDNDPVPYDLPDAPKLEGVLAPNNILAKAIKLAEGSLVGPEYLVFRNGLIYTGTADGKIVEVTKNGDVRVVAKLGGENCVPGTCGRALGLQFDKKGRLYICDPFLGILRADIDTGKVEEIVSSSLVVDGHKLSMLDDLAVTDEGVVYFTHASTLYTMNDFMYEVLHGAPHGRLLRFDPATNSTELLLKDIYIANGIVLSKSQDFLLVAETMKARIIKYYIKGDKKGLVEVLIDNLPILPDNLHANYDRGTYWVSGGMIRHADKLFNVVDFLKDKTLLRKFFMKLPTIYLMGLLSQGAMVLEISDSGQIKTALMNVDGHFTTHAAEDDDGQLYLGSLDSDHIKVLDREHFARD